MKSMLYKVDLFKLPVSLQIESRDRHSTYLGQLFSLIILVYLCYSFSQSDVLMKINPYIVEQQEILNTRPRLSLNANNFALSLAVTNSKSQAIIDPTMFTITFRYEELSVQSNTSGMISTHLDAKPMHVCNESDYPQDPGVFQRLGLTNYMCLDNATMDLEGYWDESKIRYFRTTLDICQNGSKIICKPREEIKSFLKNKYFQIYYKDINYDMTNYDKPITSNFKQNSH